MINALSPEQKQLMSVVRDEWVSFCLGGDTSIDKQRAVDGVYWHYGLAKLEKPKFIAFADGPLAAQMIAAVFPEAIKAVDMKKVDLASVWAPVIASVSASVSAAVSDSVRASVSSAVWAAVWAAVSSSASYSVRDSVSDSVVASVSAPANDSMMDSVSAPVSASVNAPVSASVMDSVSASVWDSVSASVSAAVSDSVNAFAWDSVSAPVWAAVIASVSAPVSAAVNAPVSAAAKDSVWASVWAPVSAAAKASVSNPMLTYTVPWNGCGDDAGWIAWFDFFSRLGINNENGAVYRDWLKSGVWDVLWFQDLAVITCRPSSVKKDARGWLHCENGPAVSWPSGEDYFFWHGTRVSEKVIMRPLEITKEDIATEKNSEVSRAIAEKLGWDEYMKRCDTVLVDKWFDADKMLHYELWDFKKRFELTPKLLKMESPELKDGTRPHYVEPVPPGIKTCQAARAWQFMRVDGKWPTVDECNADPTLTFEVEA